MKYQLLIVFLLALTPGPARLVNTSDISGTWEFSTSMSDPRGPQNSASTFVFKQKGESLTGTQGENKITGTVKANKVTFTLEGKRNGETFKTTYAGVIESETRMSGTVEFVKGPAKWTATKK